MFTYDKNSKDADILQVLEKLISNWENEIVEFKEAKGQYDTNKVGQYFSAISNEANLRKQQFGWLIFGISETNKETIVGSNFKKGKGLLEKFKYEISKGTNDNMTFIDIIELMLPVLDNKKRVLMFKIPAAITGSPTSWRNNYYARSGESLVPLQQYKIDAIRAQEKLDWSKQIVENATIECLDKKAISIAREKYKERMNRPHITEEVDAMSDEEFLTKIKLIQNNKITNAAMLLLGNEDYDYLFKVTPEASWRLYDSKNDVKAYEIFKVPFITLSDRIFSKIRNLKYQYMPDQTTLFPSTTEQYDMWSLRELMNNCIAHSDYTIGGRIILNELEDQVILTNPGSFLPGTIETAIEKNYNPPFYRNQLLAETMVKFNMIDTQSMGIRKVFRIQQNKYFPLPDYNLSKWNQVSVTVYGKVIDENYSRVLFDNPEFDIETVYLIDQVQKHKPISKEDVKFLRKLGVIEGKMPNIYISSEVAASMDKKVQYIMNKGFAEDAYKKWIVSYLETYNKAKRNDIYMLLKDKLPDSLSDKQKNTRVKYLLQKMRKEGIIKLDSDNKRTANWVLVDEPKA